MAWMTGRTQGHLSKCGDAILLMTVIVVSTHLGLLFGMLSL
jgi:hypothetical protein